MELSDASRILAGILLLSLVTVESGGALMFRVVPGAQPATPIQQSFLRAGHAHAGVALIRGFVPQVRADAPTLTGPAEWVARAFIPIAALLLPGGFFLSVGRPGATSPNRLVLLIPAGAAVLGIGLATLGVGLLVSG